jgi:peroxiredoxin
MRAEHDHISLTDALAMTRTNTGRTLLELSRTDATHRGVLIVFLRHLGCTFCREALHDVAKKRADIESRNVRIVLVHMAPSNDDAKTLFTKYNLADIPRVSDPYQSLYKAFELQRGTPSQLFGIKAFLRGVPAFFKGHGVGRLVGDGFQMPGVFLVQDGVVAHAFRHNSVADRPDYCALATT